MLLTKTILLCSHLLLCSLPVFETAATIPWASSQTRRLTRLANGTRSSEGRVEVLLTAAGRDVWTSVCGAHLDINDARVICRSVGYEASDPVIKTGAFYGQGSGTIVPSAVFQCRGTENSLRDCPVTSAFSFCDHSQDVGLDCRPQSRVSRVRLVGSNTPSEGRLEVQIDGQWGTVCEDRFDFRDASVVCKMLGYSGLTPRVKTSAFYGRVNGSILMNEVSCSGNETSLSECKYRSQHTCSHSEDVGVQCRPRVDAVRLVGGTRPSEGRLEVQINGEWGTVCDDSFDLKDARVACRMLGQSSSHPAVRPGAYYGFGSGSILMDDVQCHGAESNLGYCSFLGSSGENCGHGEDVGVQCQPEVSGVRLVNGSKPYQGRLEVHINGQWGTVCDDGFTFTDARVVCGMLGYSRYGATVRGSAYYGEGSGEILMDDVGCTGSETHLGRCSFLNSKQSNCYHYEDVGIDCDPGVTRVRLVNGNRTSEGRLEVYSNGRWGTVCDDAFGVNDARVACRMLGYTGNTPVVRPGAYYGQGSGEILMDNVGCTGNETSLGQCFFVSGVNHNCGHIDDVGIVCQSG